MLGVSTIMVKGMGLRKTDYYIKLILNSTIEDLVDIQESKTLKLTRVLKELVELLTQDT